MTNRKICFLAQFPPPIHGLSKAVETLYDSRLSEKYEFEKIDISNNRKFLNTLVSVIRNKADLFYITISQSKGGNIRDLILMKMIRLKGSKYLIHLHGGYYRKLVESGIGVAQRKSNYQAIANAQGVVVLCDRFRSIFEGMISDDKIFVVPNCVDDQFVCDGTHRCKNDEKRVLYLSNFNREKGYRNVLEIVNLVKNENKPYHFDFAGQFFGEEEKKWFFDYVRENELDAYVTYHGVVLGEEKRKLLSESDIFILLTQYEKEGQPISILEAMANGLAIVTTNHAGIPDMVTDGVNGIVVNSEKDYEAILKRMDDIDFDAVKTANINAVEEKYREANYIDNMDAVFKKVLRVE